MLKTVIDILNTAFWYNILTNLLSFEYPILLYEIEHLKCHRFWYFVVQIFSYEIDTSLGQNYNGMLRQSLRGAVIFVSLQHFIAPALDLMPGLLSRQRREAIKALNR